MNQDNYENKLREKFKSYTPSVDESALWSDIESSLPKESDKKKYFFFFLMTGILVVALTWSYLKSDIKLDATTIVSKDSSLPKIITAATEKEQALLSERQETVETERLDSKDTNVKKVMSSMVEHKPATTETKPEMTLSNNYVARSTFIINPLVQSLATSNSIESKYLSDNTLSSVEDQPIGQREALSSIQRLSVKGESFFVATRDLDFSISLAKVEDEVAPIQPKINKWSLDFGLNGGVVKSVYSASSAQGTALINLREETERDLESLAATVGVDYRFAKNWTVVLGLTYLTQVVSSEVSSVNTSTVIRVDTISIFHSPSESEIVTGPREFLETTRRKHLRYQLTQQLLLPLTLKYSGLISYSWGYQLGVGYGLSLWTDYEGLIQDSSEQAYDLNTDIENRLVSRGSDRLIFDTYVTRKIAGLGQLLSLIHI